MRVFHLSHNDLDGYSCQLVIKRFFDTATVRFSNSGYGAEVGVKLGEIERIISSPFMPKNDEKLVLITDMNITKDDCKQAEKIVDQLSKEGHKISLQLLDHHKSGEAQSRDFKWYYLDNSRSATKITYDWCAARLPDHTAAHDELLQKYVYCVDSFDLWKVEQSEPFEFGKVLNRLLRDSSEISAMLFESEESAYRHAVLTRAFEYMDGYRYIALDDDILSIKKSLLAEGGALDTIDNLAARRVTKLFIKNKEKFTIDYQGNKGLLTFQIGNSSVLGNAFLIACPDYAFFMDVSRNGNVSLRSNDKLDVSVMAAQLFGGGGHANASGGKLGFKDFFVYSQLLEKVKSLLQT